MATASLLASKGYDVRVKESYHTYGGKLGLAKVGGSLFDTGPSLLTEPQVIDSIFKLCNEDPRKFWSYKRLKEGTRYYWQDGFSLNLPASKDKIIESLVNIAVEKPSKINKYFKKAEYTYLKTSPLFLDTAFNLLSVQNIKQMPKLFSTLPLLLNTAHNYNAKYFKNKKVIQLFDRFATYSGSNPYRAPALLNIAGAPELIDGVYYPKGGMRSIADALYKLSLKMGVKYDFDAKVSGIDKQGNDWVVNAIVGSKEVCSDVVYAGDYANLQKLLGKNNQQKNHTTKNRSTSGIVFYWEVKGSHNKLGLHNIIFSNDYQREFNALHDGQLYKDPTIYINITSKQESRLAKKNHENWFVMINVPAGYTPKDITGLEGRVKKTIEIVVGHKIDITAKDYLSPSKIQSSSGSYLGAIYGHDSNSLKSAVIKPAHNLKGYSGIYLAGGTIHPGGGVPLSIRSAKIVARQL